MKCAHSRPLVPSNQDNDSITRVDTNGETGLGGHGPVLELTYLLPEAPRIALVSALPDGRVEFTIECQPGRNYDLERSDHLGAWNLLNSFLSTNANMKVQDSPGGSTRFYRVVTR